jgi:hypothetical protein
VHETSRFIASPRKPRVRVIHPEVHKKEQFLKAKTPLSGKPAKRSLTYNGAMPFFRDFGS